GHEGAPERRLHALEQDRERQEHLFAVKNTERPTMRLQGMPQGMPFFASANAGRPLFTPVWPRLRRGGCGVAVLPKDRTAS
ncbi:hypothetical protein, partial [Delftia acidovorans]|uniref:hypothetical protein n=1 Tax=Delftia acidovorans TaxID=80866 RepID=UPI0035A1856B